MSSNTKKHALPSGETILQQHRELERAAEEFEQNTRAAPPPGNRHIILGDAHRRRVDISKLRNRK